MGLPGMNVYVEFSKWCMQHYQSKNTFLYALESDKDTSTAQRAAIIISTGLKLIFPLR